MSAFTNEVVGPLTDTELRATPVPVSGTVTATPSGTQDVNVTNVSVVVTGPLTDTELRATPVPVSGPLTDTELRATPVPVSFGGVSGSTVTQITSNSSNQTLLAANSSRKKAILFFNSGIWDVKLGATASATSRTLRVSSSNYFLEIEGYTGVIDAICTTNGKLVDVTEIA